jgi:transcriptional regulator
MYIFRNQTIEPLAKLHDFIDEFNFGIIFTQSLEATHLPFYIHRNEGELGTLYAHLSKANPQSRSLDAKEALITFSGPHAYISPTWLETRPMVPTWNYVAVHAKGRATLSDKAGTIEAIENLMRKQEPSLLYKRDIVTDEFRDRYIDYIVGVKIEICDLQGVLKLGQSDTVADQLGVVNGLALQNTDESNQLLNYMRRIGVGTGQE